MASRSHFAAPLLLAVVVALIVYVSLYPFRFAPGGPSLVEALDLLAWARAGRGEMLNNVLLYLPFGFCFALLVEPRFGRAAGLLTATLAGMLLSLYMELLQASVPMRVVSLKDLSLNAFGALAGAMLGSTWHMLGARMAPQSAALGRSRAVVVAILALWLLARLWPLVPDVGLRSRRLNTELKAPNLAAQGYTLVGGRLLPSTDRMAAQFMYENPRGVRVTLYVRRGGRGKTARAASATLRARTPTPSTGVDGPFGYALAPATSHAPSCWRFRKRRTAVWRPDDECGLSCQHA